MEKSNTTIHAATAFILGSLAGAGIALIFAPQSGKRTPEDLRYWGKVVQVKSEKAQREPERGMKNLVAGCLRKTAERGRRRQAVDRQDGAGAPGRLGIRKEMHQS